MVILGGRFDALRNASGATVARRNLAAVDASTGALLSWAPQPNGEVRALLGSADGRSVYVGGTFTSIGTASRTNLAAVSVSTGAATSFRISAPNGGVRALRLYSGSLYVGGTFWKIGSTNRGGGAALDPTTGALKAWNPNTDWGIFSIVPAPDGSGIFVGGPFSHIAGVALPYLAKVSVSSGSLTSWRSANRCNDSNRCHVFGLVADGSTLYVAAGGPGGRLYALSLSSGNQRWTAGTDGDFQTSPSTVTRSSVGVTSPTGSAASPGPASSGSTSTPAGSSPTPVRITGDMGVWSLLIDGNRLRVGGEFTRVGNSSIARYTTFAVRRTCGVGRGAWPQVGAGAGPDGARHRRASGTIVATPHRAGKGGNAMTTVGCALPLSP